MIHCIFFSLKSPIEACIVSAQGAFCCFGQFDNFCTDHFIRAIMNVLLTNVPYCIYRKHGFYPRGMLYDLGVEMMDIKSKAQFREALSQLDREFHLVLILEELDESLLLLRKSTITAYLLDCLKVEQIIRPTDCKQIASALL